jgi:hypothetical protein
MQYPLDIHTMPSWRVAILSQLNTQYFIESSMESSSMLTLNAVPPTKYHIPVGFQKGGTHCGTSRGCADTLTISAWRAILLLKLKTQYFMQSRTKSSSRINLNAVPTRYLYINQTPEQRHPWWHPDRLRQHFDYAIL